MLLIGMLILINLLLHNKISPRGPVYLPIDFSPWKKFHLQLLSVHHMHNLFLRMMNQLYCDLNQLVDIDYLPH